MTAFVLIMSAHAMRFAEAGGQAISCTTAVPVLPAGTLMLRLAPSLL